MRRKSAIRRLESIGRLRDLLRASVERLRRRLAERPAAPCGEDGYAPTFEHLDAELAAVESGLTAFETAYDLDRVKLTALRHALGRVATELYHRHAAILRLLRGVLGSAAVSRAALRTGVPTSAGDLS